MVVLSLDGDRKLHLSIHVSAKELLAQQVSPDEVR